MDEMNDEELIRHLFEGSMLANSLLSHNTFIELVPPEITNDVKESSQDFSLVHLCCKEITKNMTFLKEISACLPINRYPALMKEAIRQECSSSAAFLMSTWPSKIISISEVVPDVLDPSMLRDRSGCSEETIPLITVAKRLNLLVELFLDGMEDNSSPTLRILDLRGLYLAEVALMKLLREVMSFTTDESENYHFIIDCEILTDDGINQITSFLENQDLGQIKARLHINRLDLSQLDESSSWKLLQLVDCTELVGLWLRPVSSLMFINMVLQKFLSLTMLNISLPQEYFPNLESETLSLRLIRNLRRLTLCGRHNDLSVILPNSILGELEYLDIESFRPKVEIADDLHYLVSVPLHLRELKLRGFEVVESQMDLWRKILRSLAPCLRVLELEKCFKNDDNFDSFVMFMLPLINLWHLNLSKNRLSMKALMEHATKLGALPQLNILMLPYNYTGNEIKNNNIPLDDPTREDIKKRFEVKKSPSVNIEWHQTPKRW